MKQRERRSGRDRRKHPPIAGHILELTAFTFWAAAITFVFGALLGVSIFALVDVIVGGVATQVIGG